ncbi:hypothetical protein COT60_01245 [Candidatus Pacearchaeota archaeon CG09_land_8_20_14_0_10_30_9]|nr:MAG: hypothetical protein QJ16_C0005G0157 [archaeon GW2011_AR1]MBS3077895.1 GtrA family protein [Candidatus Pacearchaeota archaeon]OIO40031.1 MAG: hypothetical protein AUJ61_02825 [Candidatus Pacearchaeota archaeon CG1_02_30_18]PIN71259.1 MAG: hypothetical protein COV77_02835 [Candidatus Pacearchaeota archaeon CG11_big_fil_rev_8_21_14_0_20_30_13]PIO01293.1 MAG: hypothetical protein COT60_01245 [Candidatus Pacearchaeota archaeon CG09_land_8_20_14_0_10_30_9]PIZ81976.1 MAG: hypothetical protei
MVDRKDFVQFFKYALVGFSGIFVNLFFLYFFTEFFKIYYLVSSIFSFGIATFSNFFINKIWTFREKLSEKIFAKGTKFLIVAGISLLVNTFFLYLFTDLLDVYYIISQILASGFTLITNFIGNRFWTFRE